VAGARIEQVVVTLGLQQREPHEFGQDTVEFGKRRDQQCRGLGNDDLEVEGPEANPLGAPRE